MSGLVLRRRIWLLFGPPLLRFLLMLVMRELAVSAPSCFWSVYASCCFVRFQGADSDAEPLSLTEQLFDAALGELSVVARGQPYLLVGDFNVESTKIPCLAKGISAGLWVDMEEAWALAAGSQPAVTCKRTWDSLGGHRRDFMVGCPLAVAAGSSCKVLADRWVAPHLAVRTLFDYCRWTCSVTQVVRYTPL